MAVLALAGGLLFGFWAGAAYTFLGAVLNCTLMFFLARRLGKKQVERMLRSRLGERADAAYFPFWRDGGAFCSWSFSRLIPAFPYNLINYAYGLSAMDYKTYILASAIGIIPGTFAFINIGDHMLDLSSPGFWTSLGLMALLLFMTAALGKLLFPNDAKIKIIHEMEKKMRRVIIHKKERSGIPPCFCILLALALFLIAYLTLPAVSRPINRAAAVLGSANVDAVVEYIRSFGAYAMVFSFFLMVFSSVAAPLPAFLITLSNAAIFGWWQGAILSWSSAMAGAALCFFISRGLGRDMVERFAGKGALASVETYFEKYGSRTVLVCRLLPFVSFDAVSYFAGLTPIRFTAFFVATGIGQLPATVVYSYVGGMLTGGVKYLVTGLLCIFSLGILGTIFKQLYNDRQAKKAGNAHE